MFQQVILRSVGDMLRMRANISGLFIYLFSILNRVERDPYLL